MFGSVSKEFALRDINWPVPNRDFNCICFIFSYLVILLIYIRLSIYNCVALPDTELRTCRSNLNRSLATQLRVSKKLSNGIGTSPKDGSPSLEPFVFAAICASIENSTVLLYTKKSRRRVSSSSPSYGSTYVMHCRGRCLVCKLVCEGVLFSIWKNIHADVV